MGVVENVKEVGDLVRKFNDIDLNRRILVLENEVLELSRAKRYAEEKVEEMEDTLRFKAHLSYGAPFYWLEKDGTPYCPGCWEDKHKAVHVVRVSEDFENARLDCPICARTYCLTSAVWHNLQSEHRP